MSFRKLSFLLLVVVAIGLSIQPVSNYTAGAQSKYTSTGVTFTTEGGNVTNVNISQNVSTEKWAGIFGNITGAIILGDGTNVFYDWTWTSSQGGVICAQPETTADFDWTSTSAATGGDVDNAFSFDTGDSDSATNTLTESCTGVVIAGTTYSGSAAVTASGFQTCALKDTGTPSKTDLSFCTTISAGTTIFDGGTADFALMLPTNQTEGAVQDYVFWLELG